MKFFRNPTFRPPVLVQGCIATVGAFDGLHLGHRCILKRVVQLSRQHNLPALVFSFEPLPKEYFSREQLPARLMKFREKFLALDELGIDAFYCPRFEPGLAGLMPDVFIDDLLVRLLNVKHLIIGDDFQFGYKRLGGVADLEHKGAEYGFSVEQVGSVFEQGGRVSSSVVRAALESGDMEQARQLLGGWYSMSGKVVQGQLLGRELGMPTANVKLNRKLSPVQGIFAVRVGGLQIDGQSQPWLDGVASVGTRPTVGGTEPILEVHIFDFDWDIYGAHIQVEFVAKLRDEVHFDDIETLRQQMFIDAEQARDILKAA
ncbi:MAG: bifunctional riboflavin kinase/FAD synthetase [Gammaproteobacteria bacterium]|nr:bifunctional riboflavin kinase/FAD synthetase [Gammaproteobacteria bacterium]MCP4091003.1 bifunctional riboflavin kinase/FAD synthetase [Gammaproteobacteria bacterium]MCP4277471.1 bifunctional riboflavin kinase/FAD synthetase [Gammaproteobacteria bacterium]MCP4831468.1 bifunctional riboflavin kinase/FAD synthetase [Gammaproteobacteria bacterium]MCP4930092.1 bifunctional riboflavin kinase/FAD synthetase [Gammaproteobacteria bacterium]